MGKETLIRKTCHTKCYVFDTLWSPGDIYEGKQDPGKHFSHDGKLDKPLPPSGPGDDPRPTTELRKILKDKFGSTKPSSWQRKQVWTALRDFETAESRDASTNPSTGSIVIESFPAKCGFVGKSQAGALAHERACAECKAISEKAEIAEEVA